MMNWHGEKKYDLTVFGGLLDYYNRKKIGLEYNLIALSPYGTSYPQYEHKDENEEKKHTRIFHNTLG